MQITVFGLRSRTSKQGIIVILLACAFLMRSCRFTWQNKTLFLDVISEVSIRSKRTGSNFKDAHGILSRRQ